MTEREYRALPRLSYSWVKLFIENRLDFYERFVLKMKKKRDDTKEKIFGTLVDTLSLSRESYPERFVEAVASKPEGHMGQFLDELYDQTLAAMSEEGFITKDLTTLMEEAYRRVAFDATGTQIILKTKPLEKLMAEFPDSVAEKYYMQQRACTDKYLVDAPTIGYAEKVVDLLYSHDATSAIMNRRTAGRYTVYNQLIILFDYLDTPFKSMLDRVEIDHELKVIQPYDLKTTFNVEDFDFNYRKLYYYIQGLLYYYALCSWKEENGLHDYRVQPMEFILAHSSCKYDPLLRPMTREAMKEARDGFSYNGRRYMGLVQAVENIKWHQQTGIWTMSRDNYNNGGILPITTYGNYEYQRD